VNLGELAYPDVPDNAVHVLPLGTTEPHVPHASISSYEGVVPKTTNWRSLGGGSEAPRERARAV